MTRRLRPGWMVAFFGLVVSVSAWLPWLTTSAGGGGWASGIGGIHGRVPLPSGFGLGQLIVLLAATLLVVGAMAGRGLSEIISSVAALIISLLIVMLTVFYYKHNATPPVSAEYGLYVGAAGAVFAVACSVWSMIAAVASRQTRR